MITYALKHLGEFPAWIQLAVQVLSGLLVMITLIASLMKILLAPSMQKCLRCLGSLCVRFSIYLREQMDDPTARQGEMRVIQYLDIVMTYLMFGLTFSIGAIFTILWAIRHASISVVHTFVLLGYVFLCWIVARVLKAQGKLRASTKM